MIVTTYCVPCRKTTTMLNPMEKTYATLHLLQGTCNVCGSDVYKDYKPQQI